MWRPVERNAVGRVVCVKRHVFEERFHLRWQDELIVHVKVEVSPSMRRLVRPNRIDQRVEVKAREVWVLCLNVGTSRVMIHANVYLPRSAIVQVRKRDTILGADLLSNDDLVDVVELVPILFVHVVVTIERLKLRPSGYGQIQSLRGVKRLGVEEVKIVAIRQIAEQLRGKTIERAHDRHVQSPAAITGPINKFGVLKGSVSVVKPVQNGGVFFFIKLHLSAKRQDLPQFHHSAII